MNFQQSIKRLNYKLAEYQKKKKTSFVFSYPYWLTVDPSNICNLGCVCCPTGQKRGARSQSTMPLEKFKRIIDKFGPYLLHIDFCNWGEPLLNQEISKMIAYAKRYGPTTKIDTNLNIDLNEKTASELVGCGADKLTFSIDGASQETYEKYRVNGNFNMAIENMKLLVNAKRKLKSSAPVLHWQFLVFRHNEHEIEKARLMSKEIGVDSIGFTAPFCSPEMASTIDEYNMYKEKEGNTRTYKSLETFCEWPWDGITINADGSVSPCCSVEDQKDDFDNIFNKPFWLIWNGKKYRQARKYIRNRKRISGENVCVKCDHIGVSNHMAVKPPEL